MIFIVARWPDDRLDRSKRSDGNGIVIDYTVHSGRRCDKFVLMTRQLSFRPVFAYSSTQYAPCNSWQRIRPSFFYCRFRFRFARHHMSKRNGVNVRSNVCREVRLLEFEGWLDSLDSTVDSESIINLQPGFVVTSPWPARGDRKFTFFSLVLQSKQRSINRYLLANNYFYLPKPGDIY